MKRQLIDVGQDMHSFLIGIPRTLALPNPQLPEGRGFPEDVVDRAEELQSDKVPGVMLCVS